MICPKCQGRKVVNMGPRPTDVAKCSECDGSGQKRMPGYLGLNGFLPTPEEPAPVTNVVSVRPPSYESIEAMLGDFDEVNRNIQDKTLDNIREAARRGVRIIADHRIHSGEIALLVSPRDFARIKEK